MTQPVLTNTPTVTVTDPIANALNKLLKPGTKTSEFVMLVAIYGGALATLFGAFNTSSPRFNAILKVAALVAAAASHIGYALSRGDVKAALGALIGDLTDAGLLKQVAASPVPLPGSGSVTDVTPTSQSGFADLGILGVILLIAGIVLAVISGGHLVLLVIGIVVAVIGFALLFGGYAPGVRRRF